MNLVCQKEKIADCLEEIKPILQLHYKELCTFPDKMPLDPQYEQYLEGEKRDKIQFITVRDGDILVGYYVGLIGKGLHYQTILTNLQDIFYVHPDYRMKGLGKILFEQVLLDNQKLGIKYWKVNCKVWNDAGHFFEKFGFKKTEEHYALWIGD